MEQCITDTVAVVVWWTALAWVLDWFWLDRLAVGGYALLLLLDFGFWVLDAYMIDRNSVTSHNAWKWFIKKTIRILLPFIIVIILKSAGLEKINIDYIVSTLVLWEGYSIIGHILSIDQGKQLPKIGIFQWLCKCIANLLKKAIKEIQETQNEHK